MKLIELPRSPFWGANIHVGYTSDGIKKYSPRSSKIRRDPERKDEYGRRMDTAEARRVLAAMQEVANRAMATEKDQIERKEFEEMVRSIITACGKTIAPSAPPWESFSDEVLDRQTKDLAGSTRRSYYAQKAGFEKHLNAAGRLKPGDSLADFKLADIQTFYDWWIDEGGQTSTANAALDRVSFVFEQAVIADYLDKNPCRGVKRRDNLQIPKQPFTLADLAKITGSLSEMREEIDHAEEWDLAIRFAIFTGARESDCVARKWEDFSDDCKTVRFVPKKKERLHALKKVDASVSLMLPEFLATEIAARRAASESEWMTPSLRTITSGKRGLGPRFREIMDCAAIDYEVRKPKGNKGIAQCSHGFHSFRHTLKTELRAAGVSEKTNHFVTGHDDSKVGDRYIHEKSETVFRECSPVFEEIEKLIG